MARIYDETEQKDSAVIYYQWGRELARKIGNQVAECDILCELGSVYTDLGKYPLAFQCLYLSLNNPDDKDPQINQLCLGQLYVKTHQTDSAYFYLNKCLSTFNIYTISEAYKALSLLEENNLNFKEAIKYTHFYTPWQDSIVKITNVETIRKMTSLYNYRKAETKSNRLMADYKKKQLFIYQLILLIVIIIGGSVIYILYAKNKERNLMQKQRQQDELREQQQQQNQTYIEENEQKIKELENQLLLAKEKQNEKLTGLIQAQKNIMKITNQKIIKQARLVEHFKQSDIYLKFQDSLNMDVNKMTDDDWNTLQEELNNVYDNFTKRLYALYPQLSIIELRICCLLKISVTVTNMAKLLGRSKSAITASRIQLHGKLRGEKGSAEKLDEFIVDF